MTHTAGSAESTAKVRLDKWLWAARFFKTRSLSAEAITKGRVRVNGGVAKPSREVKVDDQLELLVGDVQRTVVVRLPSGTRGSATVAATLFEETAESVASRLALVEQRRLSPEPAHSLPQGRPTKRNRRDLQDLERGQGTRAGDNWNNRWSASVDE